MAKAKASRHLGRADKIALQQLIERRERGRLRNLSDGRRELGVKRIARNRGTLQQSACSGAEAVELLYQRKSDRRRNPLLLDRRGHTVVSYGDATRGGELLHTR
jgi:hypothetical protein